MSNATNATATMEVVTPALAAMWLERNTGNRTLTRPRVERFAADMMAGKWLQTGEAIKLSKDGRLLDGQHRLRAVVLAGVSLVMMVVRGLEDSAQLVLDTGRPRSAGDGLQMLGYANSSYMASTARSIALLTAPARGAQKLNAADTVALMEQWGVERVARHTARSMSAPRGVRLSVVSAIGVLVEVAFGAEAGNEYAECMACGDGPPALQLLRESLLRNTQTRSGGAATFYRIAERCSSGIRSWREGTTRTSYKGSAEGVRWLVDLAKTGLSQSAVAA